MIQGPVARTAIGARLLDRVEGRSSQAHWFRNSSYTQKGNLLLLRQRQVSLLVGHSLNMRQVPGSSPSGRKGAMRAVTSKHLCLTSNDLSPRGGRSIGPSQSQIQKQKVQAFTRTQSGCLPPPPGMGRPCNLECWFADNWQLACQRGNNKQLAGR